MRMRNLPLQESRSDHLRNLKVPESIEACKTHPRTWREPADEVAKPLSIVFEKLWQSGEVPTD